MKKNLAFPRDVHWRTDDDGYEFIMRSIREKRTAKNLGDAERRLWFKRGWRDTLEELRAKHRKQGIPDKEFWHPAKPR